MPFVCKQFQPDGTVNEATIPHDKHFLFGIIYALNLPSNALNTTPYNLNFQTQQCEDLAGAVIGQFNFDRSVCIDTNDVAIRSLAH